MSDLTKQFDEDMMGIYRAAKTECQYHATVFFQMLHRHKGVETAKRLLSKGGAQYGFTKLYECGRLDLTVECLVLKRKYQSLFDEPEREEARRRLREYHFDPGECEH